MYQGRAFTDHVQARAVAVLELSAVVKPVVALRAFDARLLCPLREPFLVPGARARRRGELPPAVSEHAQSGTA